MAAALANAQDRSPMKLGVFLATQSATWTELLAVATRVDKLSYDHVWVPDHVYAPFGDPHQPTFEAWTTLAAWAVATQRVRLGVLVTANTLRNPALVAKMAVTLDHASGGRAILGLGAAWFELEHRAFGFDFGGSPGERLRWLDQAAGVVRALIDGEAVTFRSPKYNLDAARLAPPPVQARLPILIGGSGERRTLRTVAKYADLWNASGTPETLRHKDDVLRAHCVTVGRDHRAIERTVRLRPVIRDDPNEARRVWHAQMTHNKVAPERQHWFFAGTPREAADLFREYARIGFHTVIAEFVPPFDIESIERLAGEVRPLVEAAG